MNTTTAAQSNPTAGKSSSPSRIQYATPAVSIFEDAEGYTIEAEMPGVTKDGVSVTVEDNELTLGGSRCPRDPRQRLYGETTAPDYRRAFDLDPTIDTSRITAKMEQGLLVLRLPKAQERKPRRITVTG